MIKYKPSQAIKACIANETYDRRCTTIQVTVGLIAKR